LPTGFTPNGDGKNDRFYPLTVGIKKISYFRVFNRWGQIVFSSASFNEGWDGKLGGIEQPSSVYVWIVQGITTDDRVITKNGTVVLIR
jgi:gliding motility-associated-like protein